MDQSTSTRTEEKKCFCDKEVEHAWDIHKDADALLHSRMQAMLISQAFLGACYAQMIAGSVEKKGFSYFVIMFVLVVLGITTTCFTWRINAVIVAGLMRVKENYLLKKDTGEKFCKVYAEYYGAVDERKWTKSIIPHLFPALFMFFWICLFFLTYQVGINTNWAGG